MPWFCPVCNNLLVVTTSADAFHFTCMKCMRIETPTASDTLRYEEVSGTNLIIFKGILLNAGKDPVNPKVKKQCKCGYDTVRQVRLGNEMKLVNTCIQCNHQWLEDAEEV